MHSRWPRDVRAALGIGESTNAGQGWGCEQARDALQHRSPTPMHLFCCDALPQGAVDTFTRQHARGQVWELERDRWLVIATRLASTTRVCRVCEVVALCTPTASGRQCQPWWRRRWATPMVAMTTTNLHVHEQAHQRHRKRGRRVHIHLAPNEATRVTVVVWPSLLGSAMSTHLEIFLHDDLHA